MLAPQITTRFPSGLQSPRNRPNAASTVKFLEDGIVATRSVLTRNAVSRSVKRLVSIPETAWIADAGNDIASDAKAHLATSVKSADRLRHRAPTKSVPI